MNIFVLSKNPRKCAAYHCDKHVVKMIIEYCQILSTTYYLLQGESPLKPTHINHPCTKRARESIANYIWLADLAINLCAEYTNRYGKVHALEHIINTLQSPPAFSDDSIKGMSPFALAMPEQYIHENAVAAYREYYIGEKSRFAKRKNGNTPYRYKLPA